MELLERALLAGIKIESDNDSFWFNAWDWDKSANTIRIAETHGPWGLSYEMDNLTAAHHLHAALSKVQKQGFLAKRAVGLWKKLQSGVYDFAKCSGDEGIALEFAEAQKEVEAWATYAMNLLEELAKDKAKEQVTHHAVLWFMLRNTGNVRQLIDGLEGVRRGQRLSRDASNHLRTVAREIWEVRMGYRAWDRGLEVHHRIPLEYAHLFPQRNPNAASNLTGMSRTEHNRLHRQWDRWAAGISGQPTAAQVLEQVRRMDDEFGYAMTPMQ
jgi:hypothetical protein